MIPLYVILQVNYPTANLSPNGNVQLGDIGNGPQIISWGVPNIAEPTEEQLTAFQTDQNTLNNWTLIQNIAANASILAQLKELDDKSIRALREPDPTYISTLTTQASSLRSQLLPMTLAGVIAAQSNGGV